MLYSMGPDGIDNSGAHDDVVNWKKKYNCKLNGGCVSVCEKLGYIALMATMVSFIMLVLVLVLSALRYLYRKNA